jgi:hypothetical protein
VLKSIFELWQECKLPEPWQTKTAGFSSQGKSFVEKVFRAGFFLGNHIKEVREELGIED